ncbi:hypothetical protein QBC46DRAFT_384794 [Diplogelasinospora grovesii]|uniref:Cut9 interacting protein Scn1 n=1 Tax=Diplogelasinospora grovesii TaxID=303347 RepID=A0AAN6N7M2_9PEZI|nr:hypothetical protein QBC46DRAFT_384794 [Diplogelasinospora grovesii]
MCGHHQTQTQEAEADAQNHHHHQDGSDKGEFPWDIGVYDAHCHPTDTMSSIANIANINSSGGSGGMKARVLTIMATRAQDQELVASVASQHGITTSSRGSGEKETKVVPAFGWHPWFSHQLYEDGSTSDKGAHYEAVLSPTPDAEFIASLPGPMSLKEYIAATKQRLLDHPYALVGELGLDKAFRLPWGKSLQQPVEEALTPGGREGRMLSPYHVKMSHQVQILKAQLRLAGELGRAVSVHGVQAHGVLFDALSSLWKGHEKEYISKRKQKMVAKGAEDFSSSEDEDEPDMGNSGKKGGGKKYEPRPFPPRICLHSFSGPPQMLNQYLNPTIPAKIFFSFSMAINLSTAGGEQRFADVIKACPDDRVLIESDLHIAGEEMDRVLEQMYRKVCEVKEWGLEEGVRRIAKNYEEFIFG